MSSAGPPVLRRENRKHNRVVFTRTVKIVRDDRLVSSHRACNLSLGGLYLEGKSDVSTGQMCRIMLSETGSHSTLLLHFDVLVTRVDERGLAVEFMAMEDDSYMFLQTMVLYSSDDPLGVVTEFLEDFSRGASKAI